MDADAPFHSALVANPRILLRHQLLQRDRALDGADHRAELDQDTIARRLDDAAAMLGDERIGGGPMLAQPLRRACFVEPHQARIAGHIGGKDRGKAAFDGLFHVSPGQGIIAGLQCGHGENERWPCSA